MSYLLIKDGRVVCGGKTSKKDILINDGIIIDDDFKGEIPEQSSVLDVQDRYVSAGFIDLHLHGGGGYDFMDLDAQAFRKISHIHLINGTTTMLPTAVSTEFENILKLIEVYSQVEKDCGNFCGLHLEGPFISKNQKGAHKEHLLHCPSNEEIEALLSRGTNVIKRITAAPELENMEYFARKMQENDILLSIGHSDADSDKAKEAFKNGFSLVTHFFNATTSVRKINQRVVAGINEAALLNPEVYIEIIADGHHTAVEAVQLAVKLKGTKRVALVTDALRPTGLDVKESYLGEKTAENRVIIEDGVAKLPDRSSFAGSIATSNTLLKKGVKHYGFCLADTVEMLTQTPAAILKLKDKGVIKNGYVADIAVFDEELNVTDVILKGNIVKSKIE